MGVILAMGRVRNGRGQAMAMAGARAMVVTGAIVGRVHISGKIVQNQCVSFWQIREVGHGKLDKKRKTADFCGFPGVEPVIADQPYRGQADG